MAEVVDSGVPQKFLPRIQSILARCNDSLASCKSQGSLAELKTYQGRLEELLSSYTAEGFVLTNQLQWLRVFSKLILDFTYHEECVIVENEFNGPGDLEIMDHIESDLNLPLTMAASVSPDISTILGEDLLECIRWRKGALCYMFCATIHEDEQRRIALKDDFQKRAESGVMHLQEMLGTRAPVSDESTAAGSNHEVSLLLKRGVFSDTHMLALMYSGELSFWICQEVLAEDSESYTAFKKTCIDHLTSYVDFSKRLLQGFDYTKAEQMLCQLE